MGAWEIFLGLPGETPEGQPRLAKCRTLAKPVQPELSGKAKEGQASVGPVRGTLFHTLRPHGRSGDTNGG